MHNKSASRTKKQLVAENKDLRARLDEAEETLRAIRSGEVDAFIVSGVGGEQVVALMQVEEALRLSEEKYRTLVDEVNDGFYMTDNAGVFIFANPALARIYGVENPQALIGRKFSDFLAPEKPAVLGEVYSSAMKTGHTPEVIDGQIMRSDGTRAFIEIKPTMIFEGGQIVGTQGVVRDITERKRAEQEIANLAKFPSENPNPVLRLSRDGIVMYANAACGALLVMWGCAAGGSVPQFWRELIAQLLASGENKTVDIECDGKIYSMFVTPIAEPGYLNLYGRDITERKRAEEELKKSEGKFRAIFDNASDGMFIVDLKARKFFMCNTTCVKMLGYSQDEFLNLDIADIHPGEDMPFIYEQIGKFSRGEEGIRSDLKFKRKNGSIFASDLSPALLTIAEKKYLLINFIDITARKKAEERIQRQLKHLTAMSGIDRVIAANFDLKLSLSEILTYVTMELGIDAADILILNPGLQMLEYGAEHGFRTKAVRKAQIRLGESYAGRAALERQLVQIPDLGDEPDNVKLTPHWKGEEFSCYYGVPLLSKGQVKGVLEVFHRTAMEPDAEWFDFLNALAGQTAIAIENSTLFENLQRSNFELALAYDATIEGWSHALDLRDKETEGHTQRVTEMTVKLARALGLSEEELVQIRWGALLHDIGKLGVPDGILLKPGPLTDEEWVAMKKHPTFAYEMLSPIHYLRLALDIPYCHHEKWDGTGYPQGLKGTQIPLVARIFAVVDVWDALSSDRPYRAAWTKEKVCDYIRTLSGTDFDPRVVDVFMLNQDLIEASPIPGG